LKEAELLQISFLLILETEKKKVKKLLKVFYFVENTKNVRLVF